MTVKGHGFNGDNIDAKVDGVPCLVFEKDQEHFKCITGSNSNPSPSGKFIGQHGLRRKFINATYQLTYQNITNSTEYVE